MFRYRRAALAVGIAILLGLPACLRFSWGNDIVATAVIVANFPGILFVGRHYPPEGYPGESPFHFGLMLVIQAALWYLLFYLMRPRRI